LLWERRDCCIDTSSAGFAHGRRMLTCDPVQRCDAMT
jgi:hypothetical protein